MRRTPRWTIVLLAILLLAGAGSILALIPTQYVALEPHHPINLAGRVRINSKPAVPLHGQLYFVGVEQRRVSLLQKWLVRLDPAVSLELSPQTMSEHHEQQIDRLAIESSKDVAAAVAFDLLGTPARITGSGALVTGVDPKGPAHTVLRRGDYIMGVGDSTVHTSVDVAAAVAAVAPGTKLRFRIRRHHRIQNVTIATAAPPHPDATHRSRIGIGLNTPDLKIHLPKSVTIRTGAVGGPSAGLPFSLGIFDAESPIDLMRGRYIVATGALTLEGQVLPIGGVRQKAISAQNQGVHIMLVPTANAADAVRAISDVCRHHTACVSVLPVATVADAVKYLQLPDSELASKFAKP